MGYRSRRVRAHLSPPPFRKALGVAVPLVVGGALLAGCGAASPAAGTGGSAHGSSTAATGQASAGSGSGCAKGATGTSGFTLAVAMEPAAGVAKPSGACWGSIAYTGMNNPSVRQAPSGDTGQFKVAWNAQNLYILAWVQEWPLNDANSGAMHKDDAVEFYFAGDNTKGNSYDNVDCQVTVTYQGQMSQSDTCNVPKAYTPIEQVVQNKGYYSELIVPWNSLGVTHPAKGQQYAFTIAYDIGDANGNRVAQMEWAGGQNDDWQDTANWGTITLQ
jgi:hypothetical protein